MTSDETSLMLYLEAHGKLPPVGVRQEVLTTVAPRARDELFEALAEVCGYEWRDMTRSSRGRLNSALAELREVDAEPRQVRMAAQVYRTLYQGASLTPQALTANWPDLMRHVRASQLPPYDPVESHRAAMELAGERLELPEGPEVPMPPEIREEITRVADRMGNLDA